MSSASPSKCEMEDGGVPARFPPPGDFTRSSFPAAALCWGNLLMLFDDGPVDISGCKPTLVYAPETSSESNCGLGREPPREGDVAARKQKK